MSEEHEDGHFQAEALRALLEVFPQGVIVSLDGGIAPNRVDTRNMCLLRFANLGDDYELYVFSSYEDLPSNDFIEAIYGGVIGGMCVVKKVKT